MVANESYGCGEKISRSPEVVPPSSEAGVHFVLTVSCSSREEGVSCGKNNLKYQCVVGISSGMAHSRDVYMEKRIHVPRRFRFCSCKNEAAGESPM